MAWSLRRLTQVARNAHFPLRKWRMTSTPFRAFSNDTVFTADPPEIKENAFDVGFAARRQRRVQPKKESDTSGVEFESWDHPWNMKELPKPKGDEFMHEIIEKFMPVGGEKMLPFKIKQPKERKLTPPKVVEMERDEFGRACDYGIRKSSKAYVWIKPGSGNHFVNGVPYTEYFQHFQDRRCFVKPFQTCDTLGLFDVWAMVKGGGMTGQSGAIQLGIAKALQKYEPEYRPALRSGGMLTVDLRKVERKKAGRKKARKMKTWVKR